MAKSNRNSNPLAAAKSKVINTQQLGGIETSVLDNGPGRGSRIAWVNTGSPLRYKVVIDRGLDIAEAFFGPYSLAWLSHGGITAPTRALDQGFDWLRGFYGGLVVSCGPDNVGPPANRDGQECGLHGRHSNTPAILESVVNPDLANRSTAMSITGTVRTAKVFGPNIEMKRTISSELGQPTIKITDTFRNCGNQRIRHAWLLHINFGYPLLDKGTELLYSGKLLPIDGCEQYFSRANKFKTVPEPTKAHRGTSESCTFIEPKTDRNKMASVGLCNAKLGLGVEVRCSMKQFQRILNWQHWGPGGEYVTALEPINSPTWMCASGNPKPGPSHFLRPGQTKTYEATITVHNTPSGIAAMRRRVSGKK